MRSRNASAFTRMHVAFVAAALALVPAGLALNFYLPSQRLVRVLNSDVYLRGRDRSARVAGVYQIFTEDPDTKRQHVYHNEDTGWRFPFYFKFNSADLQSEAASIASGAAHDANYAVITSYGWRFNLLSIFPNAVSIRRASRDEAPVPWFNIAVLAALATGIAWVALRYRRWRRLWIAPPEAVRRVSQ